MAEGVNVLLHGNRGTDTISVTGGDPDDLEFVTVKSFEVGFV